MKKINIFALLFVIILSISQVSFGLPVFGSIKGTVRDAGTGMPLAGVTLYAFSGLQSGVGARVSSPSAPSTMTDSSGKYILTGLPVGSTVILANLPGYLYSSKTVSILTNTTTEVNYSLTQVPSGPGSIKGVITDASNGEPISGARVILAPSGTDDGATAYSDDSGNYEFDNFNPGTAFVTAAKDGYYLSGVSTNIPSNSMGLANLALSSIPEKGAVRGVVRDASSGAPLAGISLSVLNRATPIATVVSDARGRFIFPTLDPGPAVILASGEQVYFYSIKTVTVITGTTQILRFALNQIPPDVTGYGSVNGTITDVVSGLPITGVRVVLSPSGSDDGAETFTDDYGNYSFTDFNPGLVYLAASKDGYTLSIKSTIIIPLSTVEQDFALASGALPGVNGSIRGVVTNSVTGLPVSGARVILAPAGSDGADERMTDGLGRYSFIGYNAGPAFISASKDGFVLNGKSVTILSNNTTVTNFALVPIISKGVVTGTVYDNNGSPLQGVSLSVINGSSIIPTVMTDENGQFIFPAVDAGPASILATGEIYYFYSIKTAAVISNGTTNVNFYLTPIRPLLGSIQGTVTDTVTGIPVPDARVILAPSGSDNGASIYTDENGKYIFTDVNLGPTFVIASKDGYFLNVKTTSILALNTVVQNFALIPVTPPVAPIGSIKGTVTDVSTMAVIGNVQISVTVAPSMSSYTSVSDSSGKYILTGLPTGNAYVTGQKAGYNTATRVVSIIAASTTVANMKLESIVTTTKGSLDGYVYEDSTYTPISGAIIYLNLPAPPISGTVNRVSGISALQTSTDSAGHYVFQSVDAGRYNISAVKAGFFTGSTSVIINVNANTHQNFYLGRIPVNNAVLRGIISNAITLAPLPNTVLTLTLGSAPPLTTTTDSTGFYQFTGLAGGPGTLRVQHSNYYDVVISGVLLSHVTTNCSLSLFPINNAVLKGIVTNANTSAVIPNALITLTLVSATPLTTNTDSTGYYQFTGLAGGTGTLKAQRSNFNDKTISITVASNATTESNISMIPISNAVLKGIVTNANTSAVIPNALITLTLDSASYLTTNTDSTGFYQFTGLAGGSGTLKAQRSGYNDKTISITVASNATTTSNISLIPISNAVLKGTISNASTLAVIPNAQITLTLSSTIPLTTISDSSGRYQFSGLPSGSASLNVQRVGFFDKTISVSLVSHSTTISNINLVPIPIPAKGVLEGYILDESNYNPIPGAVVYLKLPVSKSGAITTNSMGLQDTGIIAQTYSDNSGFYIFTSLDTGRYDVTANKDGYIGSTGSATITGNATTELYFILRAVNPLKGAVKGKVTDANTGLPLKNVFVFVSIEPGVWYSNLNNLYTKTDSTGNYLLKDIPYGNYTIKAIFNGYINGEQPVAIISGGTTLLNFALMPIPAPEYGSVNGTISDSSTALPIANAIVYIASVPESSVSSNDNVNFTYTNASGYYSISSVRTGIRTVVAYKYGYKSARQNVTVSTSSAAIVNLALTSFGSGTRGIHVSVRDADSRKSISGATVFTPVTQEILPTSSWDNFWSVSNNNGDASVGNIPDGTQLVVVSKEGYDSQTIPVSIDDGLAQININLNKTQQNGNGKKLF